MQSSSSPMPNAATIAGHASTGREIASLEYNGHNYFGKWFEKYDPKIHDAIMGPVEEFRTGDSALGYDQAKPGETFIKIGVGVFRKPDEAAYKFSNTYEIVNGGKWTLRLFRTTLYSPTNLPIPRESPMCTARPSGW